MNPFDVGLVQISIFYGTDQRQHCQQSYPTWPVNLLNMLTQSCVNSSHPQTQFLTSWGNKNVHLYPSSFWVRPQETINQPMYGAFCSCKTPMWGSQCLKTHTHFHEHPHTHAPCASAPQSYCVGRSSCRLYAAAPLLKELFETKCSVLRSPYLHQTLLNTTDQQISLWSWGPLPMQTLLFTHFKTLSTMHPLSSIHYIIAWYIGKQLLLNEQKCVFTEQ